MTIATNALQLDATAQAALVRQREITANELVSAAIKQVERLNPSLNAVITPMFEQALAAAREPLPQGPFAGVPFLLKDLQAAYEGVPMSAGSRWLKDFKPNGDSELVKRYKQAQAMLLAARSRSVNVSWKTAAAFAWSSSRACRAM